MDPQDINYHSLPEPKGTRLSEEDIEYGFVWHTTGSGKALTSFNASTLLKLNDHIHKCVFVMDRKDLDRQTREEFNRFQEGCVEENTNTAALVRRLLSEDYADKVIVTTIPKLGLALDESSKRNKQRKKNDIGFTRALRFVIDGASRAVKYYYSIPCAGRWNQKQNK